MAGADVERANNAAKEAGVNWPEGRKPFHDWLTRNYRWEKENQSFGWLKSKAEEFLVENPRYKTGRW